MSRVRSLSSQLDDRSPRENLALSMDDTSQTVHWATIRWSHLAEQLGLSATLRETSLQELLTLLGQPHRAYHNLDHVVDCLRLLEVPTIAPSDRVLLELAIWYHDAVYSPLRGDNEEASADLADRRCSEFGCSTMGLSTIRNLILVTRHRNPPADDLERFMVDIDLAILGSSIERFDRYERAVRQEYRSVPRFLYRRRRAAILQEFLIRQRIFSTDPFFEKFEEKARNNLQRAIDSLA